MILSMFSLRLSLRVIFSVVPVGSRLALVAVISSSMLSLRGTNVKEGGVELLEAAMRDDEVDDDVERVDGDREAAGDVCRPASDERVDDSRSLLESLIM